MRDNRELYWNLLLGEPSVKQAQTALIESNRGLIVRGATRLANSTAADGALRRFLIERAIDVGEEAVLKAIPTIEQYVPRAIGGLLYNIAWRAMKKPQSQIVLPAGDGLLWNIEQKDELTDLDKKDAILEWHLNLCKLLCAKVIWTKKASLVIRGCGDVKIETQRGGKLV